MKALLAVDAVNRQQKVAKAYTYKDNVWISIELFIDSPLEAANTFDRCMSAMDSAVENFVEEM